MGNTECCNCMGSQEANQLNKNLELPLIKEEVSVEERAGRPNKPDTNVDPKTAVMVKIVMKLQAWYKGILSRRTHPTTRGLKPIMIIKYVGDKLKAGEEAVRKIEEKLGPFMADWDIKGQKETLELRKLIKEPEGTTYHGYWSKATSKKEGYGQQVFPNGSKYEGFWQNGAFNGNGRYIYETGDYYVGEWKDGKADGQGLYVGGDGTTYEGGWKESLHHGKGKI